MSLKHVFAAKAFLVLAFGLLTGYGIALSTEMDAAKARSITMEEYVADFESYKAGLAEGDLPMVAGIAIGCVMVFGAFGLYEILSYGLAAGLAAIGGRGRKPRTVSEDWGTRPQDPRGGGR